MQKLLVLPNPYSFIDGDGEAMGACPPDPAHSAGKRMWIGAKLDPKRTVVHDQGPGGKKLRRDRGDARPFDQTTKFVFSEEPVEVPLTPHYLDRIREGSLLAADVATYRKAFGNEVGYLVAAKALEAEREAAIAEYSAAHGSKPAFAQAQKSLDVPPNGGKS